MRLLHLRGHGDPFTLLKILQTVRDLAEGEQVEIRSDHAEPMAELRRLLPAAHCLMEERTDTGTVPDRRLLLTKTGGPTTQPANAPKPNPTEDNPGCGTCCNG